MAKLYRIAVMVEEKDVGPVYGRLQGLKLFNVEPPQAVVMADDRPSSDLIDLTGKSKITSKEITAILVAAGRSPKSTSYHIIQLRKKGLVKPIKGVRGSYDVVKGTK